MSDLSPIEYAHISYKDTLNLPSITPKSNQVNNDENSAEPIGITFCNRNGNFVLKPSSKLKPQLRMVGHSLQSTTIKILAPA